MRDLPISFTGPMIRALLDGRKTQTRRVLKPQPSYGVESVLGPEWYEPEVVDRRGELVPGKPCWGVYDKWGEWGTKVPYMPGDRLYVREAWRCETRYDGLPPRDLKPGIPIYYAADPDPRDSEPGCTGRFRQGMHMPRWASRLTLLVTAVRVQRLQEISALDSIAEGAECHTCREMRVSACRHQGCFASLAAFRKLWESLNADRANGAFAWRADPWVMAVTFTVHVGNIDAIGEAA